MGPFAPGLVAAAGVKEGERVLDVACGTGVVAQCAKDLVGENGSVVGIDMNVDMLAVAHSLTAPDDNQLTWVEGSAFEMVLPNDSFDVVLCQQGLQYFLDKPKALSEIKRVLVPGGRLALSVWETIRPYSDALSNAVRKYVNAESSQAVDVARSFGDAQALKSLIMDAGFRNIDVHQETLMLKLPPIEDFVPRHLAATPIAAEIAALEPEAMDLLLRQMRTSLEDFITDGEVIYPEGANVAVAVS